MKIFLERHMPYSDYACMCIVAISSIGKIEMLSVNVQKLKSCRRTATSEHACAVAGGYTDTHFGSLAKFSKMVQAGKRLAQEQMLLYKSSHYLLDRICGSCH